jgi:hypothetical protein
VFGPIDLQMKQVIQKFYFRNKGFRKKWHLLVQRNETGSIHEIYETLAKSSFAIRAQRYKTFLIVIYTLVCVASVRFFQAFVQSDNDQPSTDMK